MNSNALVFEKYETVIGLEVHVQLSTKSKVFCADSASFGDQPNTNISAVSLAYPGTLPRLNRKAVFFAVRLGLALNSHIEHKNFFDRKNYFYPDLPKGYQITQDHKPVCVGGILPIYVDGQWKSIKIHHIHLEEDAGKSIHDQSDTDSYVDLNRAGVPLLEIVTEPDMRSSAEVEAFMAAIRQLVRYLDISDGNMEEGSLRCDCNISIREKGSGKLNNRCEVKNLNSMKFARRAIEFETQRQIQIVENGEKVAQQTLSFDPLTGTTAPLRSKENAHDYRYFPEPDLPPVLLSHDFVKAEKENLGSLPWEMVAEMTGTHNLPVDDALLLSEEKPLAVYYLNFLKEGVDAKAAANLLIQKIRPYLREQRIEIADFPLDFRQLSAFVELISSGKVSTTLAYERIFPLLIENPEASPLDLATKLDLIKSDDGEFIESLIVQILEQNPAEVENYKKGKKALIGFFIGEVMKKSGGKADPKTTGALLQKKLGEA